MLLLYPPQFVKCNPTPYISVCGLTIKKSLGQLSQFKSQPEASLDPLYTCALFPMHMQIRH